MQGAICQFAGVDASHRAALLFLHSNLTSNDCSNHTKSTGATWGRLGEGKAHSMLRPLRHRQLRHGPSWGTHARAPAGSVAAPEPAGQPCYTSAAWLCG